MTLRPLPGALPGTPIPDFPTTQPEPLLVPESRSASRPAEFSFPLAVSSPTRPPARRLGPVEIRGDGDSAITFSVNPEIPAISRSSMTISIIRGQSGRARETLDLPAGQAKAFLLALRDDGAPHAIADGLTGLRIKFAMTDEQPTFTVSNAGQGHAARRFNAAKSFDVKAMAENLLVQLGP